MAKKQINLSDLVNQETGLRTPALAWQRSLIFIIAVAWSLFQLYIVWSGDLDSMRLGAIHLAFALALTFLTCPGKRGPRNAVPWYDWLLLLAGVVGALYIVYDYHAIIVDRGGVPDQLDIILGTITLIVLFISTTRLIGPALMLVATVLILYALTGPGGLIKLTLPDIIFLHNGYSWPQVIQQLYLTAEGIWGTPIMVSATFVFLFVLFGALLEKAGAGKYFVDLAYSGLGGYRGGSAKAAVVGSMLTGVISGSSISNTVTTGTFTIPLMKRAGYKPEKAAAIEVAASVNGQLTPPVMGAAAFIMANLLGIPYADLIVYALVPAILSYAGLLFLVHFEARKQGLEPIPRSELPPFWQTFRSGIHYLIPIFYLLYSLVIERKTPEFAALNAIVLLVITILIQALWRTWIKDKKIIAGLKLAFVEITQGLSTGARGMVPIAVATACAGIVVGIVTVTNLGYGLTQIVEALSGGNIYLVLILAAIASIILGMGLPTTANYIVMASLVVPIIITLSKQAGYDVPLVAIHLFVFYFGILADSTPPVGLAAYAGAAIAKCDPLRTSVQAFIYNLRTAILPFLFFFHPELLLVNIKSFWQGTFVILTAFLGMFAFVAGSQGYWIARLNLWQRALLFITALLALSPNVLFSVIAIAIALIFYLAMSFYHQSGFFSKNSKKV
jgi:TRAP transporter 4TM/12TM fusion protein